MLIALFYPLQRDLFILIICFCSIDLLMKNKNSKTNASVQSKLCVCVFGMYNSNINYIITIIISLKLS